jgi:hypothetical protein
MKYKDLPILRFLLSGDYVEYKEADSLQMNSLFYFTDDHINLGLANDFLRKEFRIPMRLSGIALL